MDNGYTMRKAFGFKLQSQKNVIKLGNMIDDMWGVHLHIMLLARRYRRMFGKDVSAYRFKRHVAKLKKRTKPHWKDLPSQVVQDVVLRYGKSQDAFFQNIKDRKAGLTNRKVGRPSSRSAKTSAVKLKVLATGAVRLVLWQGFIERLRINGLIGNGNLPTNFARRLTRFALKP